MLAQWDEWLKANTVFSLEGWVTLAAIPIGIAVAWYFYRKALPLVEMSYSAEVTTLLGGGSSSGLPAQVKILFEGREINNLRKVNYIVWNSGRQPIKHDDVAPKSPIRVLFPLPKVSNAGSGIVTNHVLQENCVKQTRDDNNVRILRTDVANGTLIAFEFDYLDPSQGFNVEILYEDLGRGDAPVPQGKVIGMAGDLLRIRRPSDLRAFLGFAGLMVCGIAVAWIFTILTGSWPQLYKYFFESDTLCPQLYALQNTLTTPFYEGCAIVIGVVILGSTMFAQFRARRQVPRRLAT